MRWPPARGRTAFIVTGVAILAAGANWPTTSAFGVNYAVSTYQLPLYQKLLAFLDRDIEMGAVASAVVGDAPPGEPRALRLLAWTNTNVRPMPAGFPIIDDHPYHVVIRGYGTFDQAADVFSTLAAYAGLPATLEFANGPRGQLYAFALVRLDGAWRVFDVREDRALRDGSGQLASLERLQAERGLTDALPPPREANGATYFDLVRAVRVPEHLRPYDQMPLSRIRYEIERLLHLAP